MRVRGAFWLLVLVGLIARVVVGRVGLYSGDLDNAWLVHKSLDTLGLHAYSALNPNGCAESPIPTVGGGVCHWSYPPGYWPVIQVASLLGRDTFDTLLRLLPYAAEVVLAWLVLKRGLLASALILLSPVFVVAGAVYGQVEAIAVLPAVWAVTRSGSDRERGLLLGVAVSVKTSMLMFLAARWPVQSHENRVRTLAVTLSVLAAVMAPFALADPLHAGNGLLYHGQPGAGGLSMILQPSLTRVGTHPLHMSGLSVFVFHYGSVVTIAALAAVVLLTVRRRVGPAQTAAMLVLTLAVFGFSWWPTYCVWGIPFFLLCGHIRATAWLQVLLLPALMYANPAFNQIAPKWIYFVSMSAVWAFMAAWLGFLVTDALGRKAQVRTLVAHLHERHPRPLRSGARSQTRA